MSYNRRIQKPTSYDESVMTAMAVVPQNNNRNVTTMYHPVIEGVNPSGSNVACLNKCMKIPSNFTMEDGTEVLLVNMSAKGSMIMYRYQFNEYGHIVKVDSVKTPFDINQYRLQKPVSGVVKVFCNTITGTDFTLSGQVSALALYDLPEPAPNYEDLAKYSIMPTFSRINVSLEDGVTLVMLPVPNEFQVPATVDGDKEVVSQSEARTQEPIATGTVLAPANGEVVTNYMQVLLGSGFYTCGTKVILVYEGETSSPVTVSVVLSDGNETQEIILSNVILNPGVPLTRIINIPDNFDTIHLRVASTSDVARNIKYSLYSLDPMMYLDSDLKHLVYIQGSLSPKNIIVSGELRKQIVPLTEYIPVTEMKLPIPYDPKVFEACAMLAQMPDYGVVMKRSEYENLGLVTLDNVACVSTGECGIADYWKMVVGALKKVGIQPAQLGRKILAAGAKYGKNLLDYAEERGYAQDGDEEMNTIRLGTCSDGEEDCESLDLSFTSEDFCQSPQRGEAAIPQNNCEIQLPKTPELSGTNQRPVNNITVTQQVGRVNPTPPNQDKSQATHGQISITINIPWNMVMPPVNCHPQMGPIPIINPNQVVKQQGPIASRLRVVQPSPFHPSFNPCIVKRRTNKDIEEKKPKKSQHQRRGSCTDANESMSKLDFNVEDDGGSEPQQQQIITEGTSIVPPEQKEKEEVEMKFQAAQQQAPDVKFEKKEVAPVEIEAPGSDKFINYLLKTVKCELMIPEEQYKSMALFKYNGGWKQYVSNLYATTEAGRLKWDKILSEHKEKQNTKSVVTRQDMVNVDPGKKSFQPFIVQAGKTPLMATVIVSFDTSKPEGYTIYKTSSENVKLAVHPIMKTTAFGATTFVADKTEYVEDPVDLGTLLSGTSQWYALFHQLGSNVHAVDKDRIVYIIIEFDTGLDELEGGSFIGALDCAMFGECPFFFPEYTLSYFEPVSWPTLVAKEYKQFAFEDKVAEKFLPKWWPTSKPLSIWYETPKSFASWKKVGVVEPIPFSAELATNIMQNPILGGPFDRTWILKFNPPQVLKMQQKYDQTYMEGLVKDLGGYTAPSKQAKARYDKNLNAVKTLVSQMTLNKWKALESIITPSQASFMDAARYGMKAAFPAALGSLNSLLSQVDSVNFYKIYNRNRAFESFLKEKNLSAANLTTQQLSEQRKLFAEERKNGGGNQTKKSKEEKRAEKASKSQRIFDQFGSGQGEFIQY